MTHADIINLWPSLTAFAQDLGVPYVTAKAMRRRGSIPATYWVRLVDHAERRGLHGVTIRHLAEMIAITSEAAE
ncbi:hypothetical protein [Shinella pollutisoli]|uniref:DNA-binding protein n=1 Tax=Shinella pollutisoli TaxID=2250594 RepID=A0ABV7DAZ8_9HYPH|nr:hypothetical protein [Shinella pollutisoli]